MTVGPQELLLLWDRLEGGTYLFFDPPILGHSTSLQFIRLRQHRCVPAMHTCPMPACRQFCFQLARRTGEVTLLRPPGCFFPSCTVALNMLVLQGQARIQRGFNCNR